MTDEILDAEHVAKLLRCSTEQAEQLMRDGDLPATKVGRGWITTEATVLEWVRSKISAPRWRAPATKARTISVRPRGLPPLPDVRG